MDFICLDWSTTDVEWDSFEFLWTECYVCYEWDEPSDTWNASEIVWNDCVTTAVPPTEPPEPPIPEVVEDVGYNIAIQDIPTVIYIPENDIKNAVKNKKIKLKLLIRNDIFYQEKLKKISKIKLKNLKIKETNSSPIIKIDF